MGRGPIVVRRDQGELFRDGALFLDVVGCVRSKLSEALSLGICPARLGVVRLVFIECRTGHNFLVLSSRGLEQVMEGTGLVADGLFGNRNGILLRRIAEGCVFRVVHGAGKLAARAHELPTATIGDRKITARDYVAVLVNLVDPVIPTKGDDARDCDGGIFVPALVFEEELILTGTDLGQRRPAELLVEVELIDQRVDAVDVVGLYRRRIRVGREIEASLVGDAIRVEVVFDGAALFLFRQAVVERHLDSGTMPFAIGQRRPSDGRRALGGVGIVIVCAVVPVQRRIIRVGRSAYHLLEGAWLDVPCRRIVIPVFGNVVVELHAIGVVPQEQLIVALMPDHVGELVVIRRLVAFGVDFPEILAGAAINGTVDRSQVRRAVVQQLPIGAIPANQRIIHGIVEKPVVMMGDGVVCASRRILNGIFGICIPLLHLQVVLIVHGTDPRRRGLGDLVLGRRHRKAEPEVLVANVIFVENVFCDRQLRRLPLHVDGLVCDDTVHRVVIGTVRTRRDVGVAQRNGSRRIAARNVVIHIKLCIIDVYALDAISQLRRHREHDGLAIGRGNLFRFVVVARFLFRLRVIQAVSRNPAAFVGRFRNLKVDGGATGRKVGLHATSERDDLSVILVVFRPARRTRYLDGNAARVVVGKRDETACKRVVVLDLFYLAVGADVGAWIEPKVASARPVDGVDA